MKTSTDPKDKPAVSQRKREANRKNAAKSTGPKTEAGKAKSRLNALTHGLRAEQVVLPDEDVAAFTAERDAFFEQWKPADPTEASFVERLAAGSWRLRRCIRVEASRFSTLCREAAAAFDEAARGRVDADLRAFTADPARGLDALTAYPAGIEQLFLRWARVADALRFPGDYRDPVLHHNTLCRLRGLDPSARPTADDVALASWQLIATGDPSLLGRMPWADDDGRLAEAFTEEQSERMRGLLLGMAEQKMASLEARLDAMPGTGSDRARYIEAHCVDASPEGLALMRYEGMHDRAFRANVAQLIKLKKEGTRRVEDDEPFECEEESPVAPNEPTAPAEKDTSHKKEGRCAAETGEQSAPSGVAEGAEEAAEEAGEAVAPNEPTDGESGKADRDRGGRIWPVPTTVGEPDGPRKPPSNR